MKMQTAKAKKKYVNGGQTSHDRLIEDEFDKVIARLDKLGLQVHLEGDWTCCCKKCEKISEEAMNKRYGLI